MSKRKASHTPDFESPMTEKKRGKGIFMALLTLFVLGLAVRVITSDQDS